MKTIKVAFYKVEILKKKNQPSLTSLYTFEELMKELATKLNGNTNKQVIEINKNGLETSIWFDYFNNQREFGFENKLYFLLAKDVNSIMKEDKEKKKLAHKESIKDNIHLKIPAHFVYFPDKEILGIEELENAPTKSVIKKAIKKYIQIDVNFETINRTNIIERLTNFQDAIDNVEFEMKKFSNIIKNDEADEWLKLINRNDSKLKIKTYLTNQNDKSKIVDMFSKLFQKQTKGEKEIINYISNMKVNFKNENMYQEAIELINNFLVFKSDRELYYEDLNEIEDEILKRIKYSKSVYETIIGFYNEYFNE